MTKKLPLPILRLYIGFSVILFLGIEYMKRVDYPAPDWIFHYGNDFLCIPIVSFIALYGIWRVRRNHRLRIPFAAVAVLVLLFTVYFEVYLPQVTNRYTGDWRDAACYAIGGLIFYGLQHLEGLEKVFLIRRKA